MPVITFTISPEDEGERIDKYLSATLEGLSRSYIQKQIDNNGLIVNEKPVKSNYRIKTEDQVVFTIPEAIVPDINPENIPLDIVYEDEDVCIVNKPQGMVVHPSAGHYDGTLVNALLFHLEGRLSGINGVLRPGIVHRIDKDTSGLLIICKNDKAHECIAGQLKDHSCRRTYHAVVHGVLKDDEGTINAPIGRSKSDRKKMAVEEGGKEAVTHYKVLKRYRDHTYVECRLETGRTHQIRVHMAYIGHPLMGDPVYSGHKEPLSLNGQVLHAKTIGFVSPTTGEFKLFDSELPEHFLKVLRYLESNG
ncbi:MAG: RluA family pseudouridine synthase [Lachnospiraceae bacterium]|nr:RluA family pseudouridine synthase [Lachnospiraceae bacterium]